MILCDGVCISRWRADLRDICRYVSRLGGDKAKKEGLEFAKWCGLAIWFVAGSNLKIA
jgi:hypothetical protein